MKIVEQAVKVYCFMVAEFLRWMPIIPLKNFILELHGADVGDRVVIYPDVRFVGFGIFGFSNLQIGNDVSIGSGTTIDLSGKVMIDNQVVIAFDVTITSHTTIGRGNPLAKNYPSTHKGAYLGTGCWIGSKALLIEPYIKPYCVIAGGSVLTKRTQERCLYAGVPAKKKKKLKVVL